MKVLIVDDDNDTLFTISEIVNNLGYKPLFANNGFECLEKLQDDIPDIVLLDIMMPRMDGFETIKRIRTNKELSKLPVYALTAYAMLSDKEVIEKNGFNGLFTKPINSSYLELKLKELFQSV
jgi:CheY-like chemotaxis protein